MGPTFSNFIIKPCLGTDPKKINYQYSEHGLISFYSPTSEGFSEQIIVKIGKIFNPPTSYQDRE